MQDSAAVSTGIAVQTAGQPRAMPVQFERVSYATGAVRILADVDLALKDGGPTMLMGPNGSGKTTLLKLANGLLMPTAGQVTFDGTPHAPPGSRAIVFQKPVMLRRTVAANIAFALAAAGKPNSEAQVFRLLELAHIAPLADRPARRLSGGEQQRLALARALARSPQVLFLDEPTASLDPSSTKLVEEIITHVASSGVKIVMSTHDLGQARRLAREVVFLAKGRVIEHAAADRFFTEPATQEARRFLAGDLVV